MKSKVISSTGFLILLFLSSCNHKSLKYDEAIRSLKVLNSDLVNLFAKGNEMEELKALVFLWDQESALLPSTSEKFTLGRPYQPFNFESSKGIYKWDSESEKFYKQENSDKLSYIYSNNEFNDARFLISTFESIDISSRPEFPVLMNAQLFLDKDERLTIKHSAEVEDNLIKEINTEIKSKDFNINGNLNRTRVGNSGNLTTLFIFEYMNKNIIQLNFNTTIGYSRMGYYFGYIDFEMAVFSHRITGKIDYDKINPTAVDYAESFNSNSLIQIMEMPGNRKVGEIILSSIPEGNVLDYYVSFSNGKKILLNEYLPVLDKILNLKL